MNDFVTDDEQVERIKEWWKDNASSVITGLVIGLAILFGWPQWVKYRENLAAEASTHFAKMTNALENSQRENVINEANIIIEEYGSSAYASLARFALAKAFVDAGEFVKAEQQLSELIKSKPDRPIEMVARKRLSAILLQQNKLDDAMNILNVDFPADFAAAFEELKGDIQLKQGKAADAREAYQRARFAKPPVANPQFLQQKLDDLSSTIQTG